MAIVPRPVEGCFDDALFDFIADSEGLAPRAYGDDSGIPTLGLGYPMLVTTPGWPPRDTLDSDLAAIGIALSPVDRCCLTAVGAALCCHDVAAARRLVAPWTPGEPAEARNSFSFTVARDQAKALFALVRPDCDAVLRWKLGRGLFDRLVNSQELVVLYALAYQDPALIGPRLLQALREGVREEVWYAIRFGCNPQRHRALQRRRDREAAMFSMANLEPTAGECAMIADFLQQKRRPITRHLLDVGFSQADIDATLARLCDRVHLSKVA